MKDDLRLIAATVLLLLYTAAMFAFLLHLAIEFTLD
jgi:hypothetical protein